MKKIKSQTIDWGNLSKGHIAERMAVYNIWDLKNSATTKNLAHKTLKDRLANKTHG